MNDHEMEAEIATMIAHRQELLQRLEVMKMDPRSDDSGRFAEFANADEVTKRKLLEAEIKELNGKFLTMGINPETL